MDALRDAEFPTLIPDWRHAERIHVFENATGAHFISDEVVLVWASPANGGHRIVHVDRPGETLAVLPEDVRSVAASPSGRIAFTDSVGDLSVGVAQAGAFSPSALIRKRDDERVNRYRAGYMLLWLDDNYLLVNREPLERRRTEETEAEYGFVVEVLRWPEMSTESRIDGYALTYATSFGGGHFLAGVPGGGRKFYVVTVENGNVVERKRWGGLRRDARLFAVSPSGTFVTARRQTLAAIISAPDRVAVFPLRGSLVRPLAEFNGWSHPIGWLAWDADESSVPDASALADQ